jgi:molybdenum cofactor guanylyltransferase
MVGADEVTGVVLAGGKSKRMGQDKALLMLNGKPLIQHVAQALQAVFAEVIVSANSTVYNFLDLPVARDVYPDYGPLGGIHAALGSVKTPYIFVAPCDTPLLVPAIVEKLLAGAAPDLITIASTADRLQPSVGVYPVGCHSDLDELLASGQRKVKDFFATVAYCTVCHDAWGEKLKNINEAGQYRELMRHV